MGSARTFCRICEAHCGLIATVDPKGRVSLAPDRDHPVSKGYVCLKGLALGELHEDPDRLNQPMKRVGLDFVPISWAEALQGIGQRVRELRSRHGDRCIAHYAGNPTYFS
ncbi:MAG: molybdopterin-dependent oxidoreductase, partial [Myxococcota bacterium]